MIWRVFASLVSGHAGVPADHGHDLGRQVAENSGPALEAGVDDHDFLVIAGCGVTEHHLAEPVDGQRHDPVGALQVLTREAYALDLRQYASWCQHDHVRLFQARRADIECFARDMEARGRARATITRRLCTIAGFYKYAVEEELLGHSPAAHVQRPRLDYESYATGLDRTELGALLVAAGLGHPAEHALI